jgi:hypothetical protein
VAETRTKAGEFVAEVNQPLGEKQHDVHNSTAYDPFGIVSVFAAHLELSLETMSPPEAFEAAQHATRHHLKSYSFIPVDAKGVQTEYRMVRKQQAKGGGP